MTHPVPDEALAGEVLRIPLIRALDLRSEGVRKDFKRRPDHYLFAREDDPEDAYRTEQRIANRLERVGFSRRSVREILHRAALHEVRVKAGNPDDDRVWVMKS